MVTRKSREPGPVPETVTYRPLFHAAARRRAEPGTYTHPDVPGIALTADEQGIAYPQAPDEVRLADLLGLPVIHDEE